MKDLIEQLKSNEKPFCVMSAEMQAKMMSVPRRHLDCLTIESAANNPIWNQCEDGKIDWEDGENMIATFRLRADYTEEDEYELCEIYFSEDNGRLSHRDPEDGQELSIDQASSDRNFSGYLYAGGYVFACPLRFSRNDTCTTMVLLNTEHNKPIRPTHVVFKK